MGSDLSTRKLLDSFMTKKNLRNYSIIIPAFNEERFIGKVLKSALKTTASEIIVVNDGSTDKTEKVVLDFVKKDKNNRIKIISLKKNKGCLNARKTGAKHSVNENLIFFDADIKNVKSSMFEKLASPLLKNKADLVLGAFENFGRVTEFTTRPLLSLFVKELAKLKQPRTGLFGIKRNFLYFEKKYLHGYGVIQIHLTAYFKGARIKEVYLGKIIHDKRSDIEKIKDAHTEVKVFFHILRKFNKLDCFKIEN